MRCDLGIERGVGREGTGAGHAQDMLAEHVEGARPRRVAVQGFGFHGFRGDNAFEGLGSGCPAPDRLWTGIEPVIGAADTLHQARHALGAPI